MFMEFPSAPIRKSLGSGSRGEKKKPQPQEINRAFETAAHTCPTAPTHPQVTGPHVLLSRLVNYLINGLRRQAKPDPVLKGQFPGQAHAAPSLPASGEHRYLR